MTSEWVRNRINELNLQRLQEEEAGVKPFSINYNYNEVITNQTLLTFYAGTAYDSTATEKNLLYPATFYATSTSSTSTKVTSKTATFTKELDKDFDFTINNSSIIDQIGIGYVRWKTWVKQPTGVGTDPVTEGQSYFIIKVKHYDGSTETTIAQGKTSTGSLETSQTSGNNQSTTHTCSLYLDFTKTYFKQGDILRITLEGWCALPQWRANDAETWCELLHDNDTSGNELYITVPFKLQSQLG